jgi:hypothetical protein
MSKAPIKYNANTREHQKFDTSDAATNRNAHDGREGDRTAAPLDFPLINDSEWERSRMLTRHATPSCHRYASLAFFVDHHACCASED